MTILIRGAVAFLAVVLLAAAPTLAGDAAEQQPASAELEAAPPADDAKPCAEGRKCCGSAACTQAREQHRDGKAAMADCPCKRNRAKPEHGG